VKHIFYSSLGFGGNLQDQSLAVVMQAHLDTERYLAKLAAEDPSFTYTSIREGLYSESTPIYTAFFDPRNPVDEVLIPHDGYGYGVAWVKRDELGEASAKLIDWYVHRESGGRPSYPYVNKKVLLTGSRVWTLAETVEVLAEVAGKEDVRIREISVDEYVKLPQVLAVFGSEEKARTWATAWEAVSAGETAVVTPDLERILGRPSESFDVTVRKHWA
jgi:hypothetical protein